MRLLNYLIKKRRYGFIGFAFLLIGSGLSVFALSFFQKMPSDSELVSFFMRHKNNFETLERMLSQEPLQIVGITRSQIMFKDPWNQVSPQDASISKPHFDSYQELMSKCDVQQVWRHNGETLISAGFSGWGFAGKGPRLAYVFRLDPPANQVKTLDGVKKLNSGLTTVYRHLSDHWFIRLTM
jgi:hypothetical protein